MAHQASRDWVPQHCETYIQNIANQAASLSSNELEETLTALIAQNDKIHNQDCINLNPATNIMSPNAERVLSGGLGSRPSLGYPGDKYEMGLEAIEQIEVITAELACEIFKAPYAEIRLASGAMANLYSFMATCEAGDTIIIPPASIGGHVTHNTAGCAGLYGLKSIPAPVNPDQYSVDLDALRALAKKEKPKLITIGGSLNLFPHPVREIRQIADECGAYVLFDGAHACGMIAGQQWPNPLSEGAHLLSMSTYKSLAGPAAGLLLTTEADLASKIDKIAFPGMTANFDVANSAALALTLLDWREYGKSYAKMMVDTAQALSFELIEQDIPVFRLAKGATDSHQFAIESAEFGGGQAAAKHLRKANLLTCGIGLPIDPLSNGDMNGLRLGTPEIARIGMDTRHMKELAGLVADALRSKTPEDLAKKVTEFRDPFNHLSFIRG